MNSLDPEKITELCAELIQWVEKSKEMEQIAKEASPEMKQHYAMVYKDYQWRVQNRIGRLWYYVCGSKDMNPFEDFEKSKDLSGNSNVT